MKTKTLFLTLIAIAAIGLGLAIKGIISTNVQPVKLRYFDVYYEYNIYNYYKDGKFVSDTIYKVKTSQ
jgi:hypothetical protein